MRAGYGFQPDRLPLAGQTPTEQAAQLQAWGLDAVFGGYDSPAFMAAAHRAGLRVYAEFNCFAGLRHWQDFPHSRPLTAAGAPLEPIDGYYGANPADPALRQGRWQALADLLRAYPVDGVWLDFIRWPGRWERPDPALPLTSFDAATLAQFSQETGIPGPLRAEDILSQHRAAWTAWRIEQVRAWVAQARALVDQIRPSAALGLFSLPWLPADFDGAILNVIGQDVRLLAPYIDYFSPMVYHRMCGRPVNWIGEITAGQRALTGKPIIPIIQSIDHPDTLPPDEYAEALQTALHHPDSAGVMIFTLDGVLSSPERLRYTQAVFTNGG
jgi:uncharacterized lipoprotein YddW (UPF0748 family)